MKQITKTTGKYQFLSNDWDCEIALPTGHTFRSVSEGLRNMKQFPTIFDSSPGSELRHLYTLLRTKFKNNEQLQQELVLTYPSYINLPDYETSQMLMQLRGYYRFMDTTLTPVEL